MVTAEGYCCCCLSSWRHVSAFHGRICSDKCTCCHTEMQVADPAFYLTQSQYTDSEPTSPSADPISPGAWQGSQWSVNFEVTGTTRPGKRSKAKTGIELRSTALEADVLPLVQQGCHSWRKKAE